MTGIRGMKTHKSRLAALVDGKHSIRFLPHVTNASLRCFAPLVLVILLGIGSCSTGAETPTTAATNELSPSTEAAHVIRATIHYWVSGSNEQGIEGEKSPEAHVFVFDRYGHEVGWFPYDVHGQELTFEYDEFGNVSEFASEGQSSYGIVARRVQCEYNADGRAAQCVGYSAGHEGPVRMTFTYDSELRLVETRNFDSDGSHSQTVMYVYGETGKKTEKIQYHPPESPLRRHTYRYNDDGTLTNELIQFRVKGTMKKQETLVYDEYGNEVERVHYDLFDGTVSSTISHQYAEYDQHGNWTKRLTTLVGDSGVKNAAEYRIIDYFDSAEILDVGKGA